MNEPETTDRVSARPRPRSRPPSTWARELLATAPAGPVLGLFCGVGETGLLAVAATDRSFVLLDTDPVACALAQATGRAVGMDDRLDVRVGFEEVLRPGETFALMIADPPPDLIRAGVDLAASRLRPGGSAVVQVATWAQVATLRHELSTYGTLQVVDVHDVGGRMLLRVDRLPAL